MKTYQQRPHIQVAEPPRFTLLLVELAHMHQQREHHQHTIAAIRAQLEAVASGGCTPEVALKAIAVIIREPDSNVGTGERN